MRKKNILFLSSLIVFALVAPFSTASALPKYTFPVADCEVNYARAHHDYAATDILAKAGCKFVAPISGVVDEVNREDRWRKPPNNGIDRGGLSVSIIGSDGVRYYGSHLKWIPKNIQPGLAVKVGQVLGSVGSTGSARGTAPHLHFGISWPTPPDTWWIRRGEVLPWRYLDSWKNGKDRSPVKEVEARKLKMGEIYPEPKK
jgi:murein DD-endopeptidase MepM/ murein hydrolase activator NlpD